MFRARVEVALTEKMKESKQLRETTDELKLQYAQQSEKIRNLEQQIRQQDEIVSENSSIKLDCQQLQERIEDMQRQSRILKLQAEEAAQIPKLQSELQVEKSKRESIEKNVEQVQTRADQAERKVEVLERELEQMRQEKEKHVEMEKKFYEKESSLHQRLEDVTGKQATANVDHQASTARVEYLENQLYDAERKIQELQYELESKEANIASLGKSVREFENEVVTLRYHQSVSKTRMADQEAVESELIELRKREQKMRSQLKQWDRSISAILEDFSLSAVQPRHWDNLERDHSFQADISSIMDKIRQLERIKGAFSEKVLSIQTKWQQHFKELESRVAQRSHQVDRACKKVDRLDLKVSSYVYRDQNSPQLEQFSRHIEWLEKELKKEKTELSKAQQRIDHLQETKSSSLNPDIERLQENNRVLILELEEKRQRAKKLQEKFDWISNQFESSKLQERALRKELTDKTICLEEVNRQLLALRDKIYHLAQQHHTINSQSLIQQVTKFHSVCCLGGSNYKSKCDGNK